MNIKLVFAVVSVILLIIAYIPYLKDIFNKSTKPHAYTWLIWAITQTIATIIAFQGGANWGVLGLAAGTLLVLVVFILSLKFGTKNVTQNDTVVLILSLITIIVWWKMNNPLLAVLIISVIDGMGYIPTYRKSWNDPHSETLSFWFMMALGMFLSILSLSEYNLLTVTYLTTLMTANVLLLTICIVRRQKAQNLTS